MLRIGVIMYQTSLTKGQELVAQRMVKEFRRQGNDAYLITSIFHDWEPVISSEEVGKRGGYAHLFDRVLQIPVVRVNSEAPSWPPRRIAFSDFVGVLARIVEELDLNVLITHSTLWNGPEEVLKFIKWRKQLIGGGAPYHPLIFCHMSHLQEPNGDRYAIYERSYREAWNSTVLPQIMTESNVVLVTTPAEGEWMKNLGASAAKIVLFPGGIEDEPLLSTGNEEGFRAQHQLPDGAKIVSFLGTVEERKNPLAVLEVAKMLSSETNIHFVIAGRIEGEYGAKVKEDALKMPNASVLGPISEKDKAGLIRASYLNINMSRSEALGISQLEFMAMGVPIITSGTGGQSWIVRDGFNGVVLNGPDDLKGAADGVRTLTTRTSLRNKLGKNAAHFAAEFSITRLVGALSKRLERELQSRYDGMSSDQRMTGEERVIEAWVHKGQNVAATSKRLIIRSAKSGTKAIIVPYDEIGKIVRFVKAPWALLAVGISATLLLLSTRILGFGIIAGFRPEIATLLSSFGISSLADTFIAILPFVPVLASAVIFALMLDEGYLVHYGSAKRIFLPKRFLKALKLADKLTPKDLFADGLDGNRGKTVSTPRS